MNIEAEKIQKAIDAVKKIRPNYENILDLFGKIMIKQSSFSKKARVKPVAITENAARAKLKKGLPLLSRGDFPIDQSNASQLFKELCEMLKSGNEDLVDEIGEIEDALEKGELDLEEIFQSVLKSGRRVSEVAESRSLDRDIIFILAMISIRPSLEATASQLRDMVEDATWSRDYCPVCGSSPAISELRQLKSDGAEGLNPSGAERILYCSFCETEWRTRRLSCAFCGNTDQESLKYLYAEEEKGYRIDVCDKCKKYIKTVDSREITREVILPVEDIATLHLDIIAEEEGYKREAWLIQTL